MNEEDFETKKHGDCRGLTVHSSTSETSYAQAGAKT